MFVHADCSADYQEHAERERADSHSRSPRCQWFLYLLHHLYRGRRWSGERQRRSPRRKCQLGQLATTDDNNDKQQANNKVVKTQWVIRSNKMGQRHREKKKVWKRRTGGKEKEVSLLLIGWGHHRKQGSNCDTVGLIMWLGCRTAQLARFT